MFLSRTVISLVLTANHCLVFVCFEEVEELSLSYEYRQAVQVTLPVPDFLSVGSLHLFLSDPHATDYIVTVCKNLRILNIKSRFPDIRIFVDGIMARKNLIHLEEVIFIVVPCILVILKFFSPTNARFIKHIKC
jgi:hypothetical protein